ncbi:MAG: carboxypeptidase-like regulatory domain-containing protein, partial [Salinivirgaceae bacterium]|nr:carboxypeptidase-like regulatory domain-containing protein [Salinivirgaceae bacterium]
MNFIRKALVLILISYAVIANAQEKTITINVQNQSLNKVLYEIKLQSGFNFIFNDETISPKTQISLTVNNASINTTMDKISALLNVKYDVLGNTIVLKPQSDISNDNPLDKQLLRQNIRDQVIDKVSHAPLYGANVILLDFTPAIATITDENGEFVLENVPVGRRTIYASYIGYKPEIINEVMLNSAKEQYLSISLEQGIEQLGEVIVRPTIRKDRPVNMMATVSARSFTVEESQRYAGGIGDPTRMASAFAGVSAGYDLEDNSISVRGNRPGAIVWRVEDVDIPNPNHFAGAYVAGAGFACLISNQLMDNSDFFTGAFPAQYGNSLGAAFDLKLRTGNNQKREYTFQAGVLGIDFASEGPFEKGKSASYNINYRYSTLGLLNDVGIIPDNVAPRYQDLSFKLNFPTKKLGTFTLWGIGGIDYQKLELDTDSTNWKWDDQRSREVINMNMGSIALAHKQSIGSKSFVKTTLVASGNTGEGKNDWIQDDLSINRESDFFMQSGNITLSSFINTRIGKRIVNRTGFNASKFFYNIDLNTTFDHDPSTYLNYAKSR